VTFRGNVHEPAVNWPTSLPDVNFYAFHLEKMEISRKNGKCKKALDNGRKRGIISLICDGIANSDRKRSVEAL
jgi:hypothetical protein